MDQVIARYAELRVPRYTSYPPASRFGADVDAACHAGWLGAVDRREPVALYLHVPFCRQVCWYCACNMKLAAREAPVRAYARLLQREIALVAAQLPGRMVASAVHWGGGTPTALPLDALAAVMAELRHAFMLAADAEIAFEIDPRTFTAEMAPALAALGATRASLGVQEFDPKVQAAVNRVQPFDVVQATVARLREAGIEAINFDLMYGLPFQTPASLARTVAQAVGLGPQRIALFGYAHVPWLAKNQRLVPEAALPGVQARFEQAETAARLLVAAGYRRIGLDHFARPDDPLARAADSGGLVRNFQGYAVAAAPTLLGFGASAISALRQGYVQNVTATTTYGRAVEAGRLPVARGYALTVEDRLRRSVIERLMCDLTVDLCALAKTYGRPCHHFAPELARCRRFVAEGLARIDGNWLDVTEAGRPAVRVIAAEFDVHLAATDGNGARHALAV